MTQPQSDAKARLDFVADHMPLVGGIADRFDTQKPFASMSLAVRIHIEAKTAVLIRALKRGGAQIVAMGNQGTTDDGISDVLDAEGIDMLGSRADTKADIVRNLDLLSARQPDLILDNGAELIERIVGAGHLPVGATEETTSGAFRLRRHLAGSIPFPVIVINDSPLKAIVENKHGVGQSVVQVIQQTTNVLIHRKRFVVFGYGWCGRGIALYARANGADVAVVEPDEIKALEAAIDGFAVLGVEEAASTADIVVTATGEDSVVTLETIELMRPGALLANAGHFDNEIDMLTLRRSAAAEPRGPSITRYRTADTHYVDVVAEGQMVNLAAIGSRGNAIEIMDLGFALQALSLERLAIAPASLPSGDQPVPDDINRIIASGMVDSMMKRM